MRPAEGGMRTHVFALLKKLNKKIFRPMAALPKNMVVDRKVLTEEIEIYPVDFYAGPYLFSDLKAAAQLVKIIRRNKICLLHVHGARAGFVGRTAALLTGVPVVIYTVHNFIYKGDSPHWQKKACSLMERLYCRFTDMYITVSKALAEEVNRIDFIPEEKITTVYNGIDLNDFNVILDCMEKKKELGLDPYAPVVGTAGRLIPSKGISYFIEAAAEIKKKFPRTQFVVLGDGPERARLESRARALSLYPNIKFLGYRRDFHGILPVINIFVMPSLTEGQSIAVLEAMAARRPIVAFAVGGIPEIISHNRTGILVPHIDSLSLASAVIELMENPFKAEMLGNNARDLIEEKFSQDTMVRKIEEIYLHCLKQKGIALKPAFTH